MVSERRRQLSCASPAPVSRLQPRKLSCSSRPRPASSAKCSLHSSDCRQGPAGRWADGWSWGACHGNCPARGMPWQRKLQACSVIAHHCNVGKKACTQSRKRPQIRAASAAACTTARPSCQATTQAGQTQVGRLSAAHLQAQHARRGKVHPHAAVGQVQAVQAGEAAGQLLAGNALRPQVHEQAGGGGLPAAAHQAQHAKRGRLQLVQHLRSNRVAAFGGLGVQAGMPCGPTFGPRNVVQACSGKVACRQCRACHAYPDHRRAGTP